MFKFKGEHATQYFDKVLDVQRGMTAPSTPKTEKVSGKAGEYFFGTEDGMYEIEVQVLLKGSDRQDLWTKVRRANAWLKTKNPVKLEFDDEPGFYYMAVCLDALEFDDVLDFGIGTIHFIAPDPYRYGKTQNQRVASAGASFMREGIRHRTDGSEVTENFPYFMPGKYGEALLVEEGTTNLLTTAATPANETQTLNVGDVYSLSTVGGTATAKHAASYTENKTLTIPGENVNINMPLGTPFNNTGAELLNLVEYPDGTLALRREGVLVESYYFSEAHFQQGTLTNLTASDGSLELSLIPGWEVISPMENYVAEGWKLFNTSYLENVRTEGGTVYFEKNSTSGSAGLRFEDIPEGKKSAPTTFVFRAKVSGQTHAWVGPGPDGIGTGIRITLPESGGEFKWFWINVISATEAELYVDGQRVTTEIRYDIASNVKKYEIYCSGSATGTIEVDKVYIDFGYAKGSPVASDADSTGTWRGTWVSNTIDLSPTVTVGRASVRVDVDVDQDQDITLKVEYGDESEGVITWDGVSYPIVESGNLPGLENGTQTANKRMRFIAELTSRDPGDSPQLLMLEASIESAFKSSGCCITGPLDISSVRTLLNSDASWAMAGEGTVTWQARVGTYDPGTDSVSWRDWGDLLQNGPIPGISPGEDLSNKRMQIKITFTPGNNATTTPVAKTLNLSLSPGYESPKTFSLPSVDVSNIGNVLDSLMDWTETKPANTAIDFEYSLDGKASWTPVVKGSSFVTGDLTKKVLDIRYTLSTSDPSVTPTLNVVNWEIGQQDRQTVIPVTGTVNFYPSADVQRWQLESKPYATNWALGTRNKETAQIYVGDAVSELEGQGSIAFWVYEDGRNFLRYLLDSDSLPNRFSFYKSADTNYKLRVKDTSFPSLQVPEPSVGWHHWAIRWQGSVIEIFLDGTLVARDTEIDFSFGAIDRFHLGATRQNIRQWNNLIEDFYISKSFLSEGEIEYLLTNPAKPDKNTVTIIPFDGELSGVGDNEVSISGTAETRPVFTATFATKALFFKVSNGTDYVLVDREFNTGDVLEIDCVKEVCRLNGDSNLAMPFVTFDSDFFALKPDGQIIVTPEGVSNVDVIYTERWL